MSAGSATKVIAFAQVTHDALSTTVAVCKAVGLAHDGSSPSPAARWRNNLLDGGWD